MSKRSLTVVVAAKNEEEQIYNTLKNIEKGFKASTLPSYEVIVINDGSTDRTGEILELAKQEFPYLKVITNEQSKGVGVGFLDALAISKCDAITFFAGDNNAHAQLAETMFQNIDKADIIVSYFVNTESRNRMRNILSTIYSMSYCALFGLHVKYINGNSIYPVDTLKSLNLKATSYSIFSEVLVKCLRTADTYYEVYGYTNPDCSSSQALSFRSLLKVIKAFFRLIYVVHFGEKERYKKLAVRAHVPGFENYPLPESPNSEISKKKQPPQFELGV